MDKNIRQRMKGKYNGNLKIKNTKTKYTKADITKINNAFYNKVEEYSKLTLDELKELFPTLGGSYREACIAVTEQKLIELKESNLKEAINDNKAVTVKVEYPDVLDIEKNAITFEKLPEETDFVKLDNNQEYEI